MGKFKINDLLNSQSKATHVPMPEDFEIRYAPIEKIKPSKMNGYGIRDIEELAAEIETVGLLENLVLREIPDSDELEIISGERRYWACRLLYDKGNMAFARLPYKLNRPENDTMAELQLHFANSARDFTDYEKMYRAARIKELLLQLKKQGHKFKGRMREIVADMIDVSPAQVGIMESIDKNLSDPLKEEFKEGNINITAAYETSRLPEEQQAEVLEKVKEKGTVDVKEVKQKRSLEERGKMLNNGKCAIDGHNCKHGIVIAKHFLKRGNVEGCAGCCRCCIKKETCEWRCDAVKGLYPQEEPAEPAPPAEQETAKEPKEVLTSSKPDIDDPEDTETKMCENCVVDDAEYEYKGKRLCGECLLREIERAYAGSPYGEFYSYTETTYFLNGERIGTSDDISAVTDEVVRAFGIRRIMGTEDMGNAEV